MAPQERKIEPVRAGGSLGRSDTLVTAQPQAASGQTRGFWEGQAPLVLAGGLLLVALFLVLIGRREQTK